MKSDCQRFFDMTHIEFHRQLSETCGNSAIEVKNVVELKEA